MFELSSSMCQMTSRGLDDRISQDQEGHCCLIYTSSKPALSLRISISGLSHHGFTSENAPLKSLRMRYQLSRLNLVFKAHYLTMTCHLEGLNDWVLGTLTHVVICAHCFRLAQPTINFMSCYPWYREPFGEVQRSPHIATYGR